MAQQHPERETRRPLFRSQEGRKAFFTVPQVKAILKEVEGRKPWDAFFWLLSLSGLRSTEILGLYV